MVFLRHFATGFQIKGNTAQFAVHALLASYSVIVSKNQHAYVSMRTDYLYTLTKNLAAQSAHLNCAVLPKLFFRHAQTVIFCQLVLF